MDGWGRVRDLRKFARPHDVPARPDGDRALRGPFLVLNRWPLRPVLPATVDPTLGQGRREFDLDTLRDPDGTIPYWRLLQREAELGFKK